MKALEVRLKQVKTCKIVFDERGRVCELHFGMATERDMLDIVDGV